MTVSKILQKIQSTLNCFSLVGKDNYKKNANPTEFFPEIFWDIFEGRKKEEKQNTTIEINLEDFLKLLYFLSYGIYFTNDNKYIWSSCFITKNILIDINWFNEKNYGAYTGMRHKDGGNFAGILYYDDKYSKSLNPRFMIFDPREINNENGIFSLHVTGLIYEPGFSYLNKFSSKRYELYKNKKVNTYPIPSSLVGSSEYTQTYTTGDITMNSFSTSPPILPPYISEVDHYPTYTNVTGTDYLSTIQIIT